MDTYPFTAEERVFFAAAIQEINALQLSLRKSVSLVIGQQKLAGNYRISDDGTGLVRVAGNGASPEAA
jgi:hypothetical protein